MHDRLFKQLRWAILQAAHLLPWDIRYELSAQIAIDRFNSLTFLNLSGGNRWE